MFKGGEGRAGVGGQQGQVLHKRSRHKGIDVGSFPYVIAHGQALGCQLVLKCGRDNACSGAMTFPSLSFVDVDVHKNQFLQPLLIKSILIHAKKFNHLIICQPAKPGICWTRESMQCARMQMNAWQLTLDKPGCPPGASSRSSCPPTRIQRRERVTPGLGAESASLLLNSLLMSADLPTLGKPTTQARTARGLSPLLALAAFSVSPTLAASLISCSPRHAEASDMW